MNNALQILIFLTFCLFLSPTFSYASGAKIEKSCCKKESTSKTEKEDCCKRKNTKDNDNSCSGKCGHKNCTNSISVNFSLISTFEIDFNSTNFYISSEKQKFYNSKTFVSSGFSSVWLIPKIS